jgi:hypothetical protein
MLIFSDDSVPTSPNSLLRILHSLILLAHFQWGVFTGNGALDSVDFALERRTSFNDCGSRIDRSAPYQRARKPGMTRHILCKHAGGFTKLEIGRKTFRRIQAGCACLSTLS